MLASVQATSPTPRTGADILNAIRRPIQVELSRALRRSFAATIDELLDRLLKVTAWEERQAISDGLDLLRNGREAIEERFEKACAEAWDERTSPAGGASGGSGAPLSASPVGRGPGLSLMDDSLMSQQIELSRIAARARRRMDEDQVDGLRARFGELLGRDWFADNEYPIAPDVILEALRKAMAEFGQARAIYFLMEVFEPKLSADLITLYANVNQNLISMGVMPEIRYRIAKTAGGSSGGQAARANGHGDGDLARDGLSAQAGAHGYSGPGPVAGPAQNIGPGQGTTADAASGPTFTPADPSPAATYRHPLFPHATGGIAVMPPQAVADLAEQVVQRIGAAQASAAQLLSDPEQFGTPGHVPAAAASEPLLLALSRIQAVEPQEGQDIAAIVTEVRSQSAAAAKEHGSPLERLIIETVSLVFEHVYEDETLADAIKQQLLRLQVVAFKAALIDPTFFARPEHPMRRFIDRVSAIGSDPDFETQAGTPLVADIAELMTWIVTSFDRDLALFDEALARVDAIVAAESARRADRLAKIAVAVERAEQLEAARRKIRDSLFASLAPDTPEFILRFVAEPWTEVIARIESGAQHAPFEVGRARRTLDLLCWSIAPKRPLDIPKLAAALPQLIADLSRGLAFIALAEAERELFFSELLAWHGATIDEAKRQAKIAQQTGAEPAAMPENAKPAGTKPGPTGPPSEPRDAAPAVPPIGARDDVESDSLGKEREDDVVDQVDDLQLTNGSEIELIGVRGEVKRFKLGWISPARTVFVFSRYPRDHWTARRPMLNRLLAEGRLRVISRDAETDRAIAALKNR